MAKTSRNQSPAIQATNADAAESTLIKQNGEIEVNEHINSLPLADENSVSRETKTSSRTRRSAGSGSFNKVGEKVDLDESDYFLYVFGGDPLARNLRFDRPNADNLSAADVLKLLWPAAQFGLQTKLRNIVNGHVNSPEAKKSSNAAPFIEAGVNDAVLWFNEFFQKGIWTKPSERVGRRPTLNLNILADAIVAFFMETKGESPAAEKILAKITSDKAALDKYNGMQTVQKHYKLLLGKQVVSEADASAADFD